MCRVRWAAIRSCSSSSSTPTSTAPTATCSTPARSPSSPVTAETAGWEGFAFTEHPAPTAKWLETGGHQSLDPFVALAARRGGHRPTLKLLTYLAVLPYRNPASLAKSAATVDKLSNGRFVLGVGTGYLKAEYFALGVDFDERNELFDEALDVMPLHWSGEPFDYAGKHFNCRGTIGRPRPVQQPDPDLDRRQRQAHAAPRSPSAPRDGCRSPARPRCSRPCARPHVGDHRRHRRAARAMLKELAGDRFAELDIVDRLHRSLDLRPRAGRRTPPRRDRSPRPRSVPPG